MLIFFSYSCSFCYLVVVFFPAGWEDPNTVDSTWSNSVPKIHFCQWCVELWNSHVGGDVIWRAALLGYDKSRCELLRNKEQKHWNLEHCKAWLQLDPACAMSGAFSLVGDVSKVNTFGRSNWRNFGFCSGLVHCGRLGTVQHPLQ